MMIRSRALLLHNGRMDIDQQIFGTPPTISDMAITTREVSSDSTIKGKTGDNSVTNQSIIRRIDSLSYQKCYCCSSKLQTMPRSRAHRVSTWCNIAWTSGSGVLKYWVVGIVAMTLGVVFLPLTDPIVMVDDAWCWMLGLVISYGWSSRLDRICVRNLYFLRKKVQF